MFYANWDNGGARPKTYDKINIEEINEIKKNNLFMRKKSNKCYVPIHF